MLFSIVLLSACQQEVDGGAQAGVPAQNYTNVSYGTDTAQRMDVYLPAGRRTAATKAVVLIHGGAWVSGNKADMNGAVAAIRQQLPEYAVFNIGYRLGALPTTNPFPTQENDVKAALAFIATKSGEYGFSTDRLNLLGASAGAHLAMLQAYKNSSPKIVSVVSLFGPADMAALHASYASSPINQIGLQLLLSGTPASNAAMYQSSSPLNFVTAQTPPTLLLHGTADPIVPYSQSTALKAKLDAAGVSAKLVTYTGAGHGDWNATTWSDAYAQIFAFLKEKNP